jgi:GNAT superfamily N-acetyltransferase
MNLNIRKVVDSDYESCAENLVAAYKGEPWNNPWTLEEALLRVSATMSGFNARGFVVENNGEVIAACLGRIDYYNSSWKQFCVDEFHVRPEFQGKGVGAGLLEFVSNALKQEGIARLFLITGGRLAAEFYGKNKFENSDDGTMMARNL